MNCEYCNKTLSNIYTLRNHQKTTKYCIDIQSKSKEDDNKVFIKDETNKCQICSKYFTTKHNLQQHLKGSCDISYVINCKLLELNKENLELKTKVSELEKENTFLKGINSILKENNNCLKDIAKQPKTVTTNNSNRILNMISPIDFTNVDIMKNVINDKYDIDYVFSGQKGIADFVVKNFLKDENGQLNYVCTDPSRQTFKYKDITGEVRKDVEAKKLTNFLLEGGIKKKSSDIAVDWWTDDSGEVNTRKYELLIDQACSLTTLEEDNTEFKKELVAMTTI